MPIIEYLSTLLLMPPVNRAVHLHIVECRQLRGALIEWAHFRDYRTERFFSKDRSHHALKSIIELYPQIFSHPLKQWIYIGREDIDLLTQESTTSARDDMIPDLEEVTVGSLYHLESLRLIFLRDGVKTRLHDTIHVSNLNIILDDLPYPTILNRGTIC